MSTGDKTRIRKSPIESKGALCEAHDYANGGSFPRGKRVELGKRINFGLLKAKLSAPSVAAPFGSLQRSRRQSIFTHLVFVECNCPHLNLKIVEI